VSRVVSILSVAAVTGGLAGLVLGEPASVLPLLLGLATFIVTGALR
jgi:hypothetical protein